MSSAPLASPLTSAAGSTDLPPVTTRAAASDLSAAQPWLVSRVADLSVIILPCVLTLLAFAYTLFHPDRAHTGHGYGAWVSRFVLGNSTHVVLTFFLLSIRRDVLRATAKSGRVLMLGSVAVFVFAFGTQYLVSSQLPRWNEFLTALIAILAVHHTLSQAKGLWALYSMRAQSVGKPPISPRERALQQLFVPLGLLLVSARMLFVPAMRGFTFPWIVAVPALPAILPFGAVWVFLAGWAAFAALVLHRVWTADGRTLPKTLYIATHLSAVALTLFAPEWGFALSAGIHGLEYYLVSGRMLRPLPSDTGSWLSAQRVLPAMLAMLMPAFVVGLLNAPFTHFLAPSRPAFGTALSVLNAIVIAHYFADALMFRFRVPEIRRVALARLGFGAPPGTVVATRGPAGGALERGKMANP